MVLLGTTAVISILLQGILFGGILSLVGVGLTLIFGVTRVLNIAHGDFLVLGGIATVVLFGALGLNPFESLIVVIPVFALIGVGFSFLMRRSMSARTAEASLASSVLVTLGLSNLIEGLGLRIVAQFGYSVFAISLALGSFTIGGVTVDYILLISFAFIIAISIFMTYFVYNTSFGAQMRASMADREVALMLGADTNRISMITFSIGIVLAAVSGTIYVLVTSISANTGLLLTTDALTVVILGGLGSFLGALLGGFVIGLANSTFEIVLTELGLPGTEWVAVVPLAILIIILIVRPKGLLKR
ncbi:MAG: branched-chain amino acid ABC transporter permease [Thaumarchaeota archaeon]|nr:branched-chain amino acid ABC transporter permease [Nitrososphaerota archaeon]